MLGKIYPTIEKQLRSAKVTEFELFYERELTRSYESKDFYLDSAKEAVQAGIGLRAFRDHRVAFGYSTDLSKAGLVSLAEGTVKLLPLVNPDEHFGLPEPRALDAGLDLQDFDSQLASMPAAEKIQMAIELERAAKHFDPRVKHVRSSTYEEKEVLWELRNSRGLDCSHPKTQCSLVVMAVAEQGDEAESSYEFDFATAISKLNPQEVGRRAAERAVSYLGATTPTSQQIPVVFHPLVSAEVFEILIKSFQGDEVFKSRSFLKDKLNTKVYSSALTMLDDGLKKGGLGSWPFDGEGQPGRCLCLLKNGTLENFLTDSYYGRKLKLASNASSYRSGIKRPPGVGYSNLNIVPGERSDAELYREVGHGILVTETIGMHAANPISGDFSVGAQGFLIERGELSRPVKKLAIAGNLHQMMANVQSVGLHHRFNFNIGAPTLVIGKMAVSGE